MMAAAPTPSGHDEDGRRALMLARFATLADEVATTSDTPPSVRTPGDFIAEALRRSTSAASNASHALSINGGGGGSVVMRATPERSRLGDQGAAARRADWGALTDSLRALRRHPDFEACLLDPAFAEAEGLRAFVVEFAQLPWAEPDPGQADAAAAAPAPGRSALGDISNATKKKGIARLGIKKMLKAGRPRAGRSSSTADASHAEDPDLADELVSSVLADPRTNVGVSSMRQFDGVTYYGIDVIGPERQWTVYRRYRQFEALQQQLTTLGKEHSRPADVPFGSLEGVFAEGDVAALLSKLLPQKTLLKASHLEQAYRRVLLDAYVRELWRSDVQRLAKELRAFLRPGGVSSQSVIACRLPLKPVRFQALGDRAAPQAGAAGWLRVGRCADYSATPAADTLPRRWVCVESQAHKDRAHRESVRPVTLHG